MTDQSPPISSAAAIGPPTCSSSDGARPSQKYCLLQARFHSEGVLRRIAPPDVPRARRRPSVKASADWWQVAQERLPSPERRVSANNLAPRATRSGVVGLSGGAGGASTGRLKALRQAVSMSGTCARASAAVAIPNSARSQILRAWRNCLNCPAYITFGSTLV